MTKTVNASRLSYRRANDRFRRYPTPTNLQAMRQARSLYKRAVRKRKRQAEAELASRIDLGFASIHRLTGSTKKDPGHQAKILPNLDKILEFWTDQFSDPEALPPEALGLDFLLNFSSEEVSGAFKQIDPNKATGDDDLRPELFQEKSDRLLQDLARLYTTEAQAQTPLPDWMKVGAASVLLVQTQGLKGRPWELPSDSHQLVPGKALREDARDQGTRPHQPRKAVHRGRTRRLHAPPINS